MPLLSIIAPVFNESENLHRFVERLTAALEHQPEFWILTFVDDGSSDRSVEIIRELNARDNRVRALVLSRNFGKEFAVAAGIEAAPGDAVVILDADLQHPPEVIPDLVAAWRYGYKVVFAQRRDRSYQNTFQRASSALYYRIFSKLAGLELPVGICDFLLLDRQANNVMTQLGERARFNKGLYAWIGFPTALVPFAVAERKAGRSGWRATHLLRFAIDGLVSFSSLPLRLSAFFGATISIGAILYASYLFVLTLIFGTDLPGFPSLIVSIMFFSGIQLIFLGVVGEYVARIFDEVKRRPLFIVQERIGGEGMPPATVSTPTRRP